eukprot:g16663.t1
MASKKCALGVGLAGAVAGSAFLAPTGSQTKGANLRSRTAQATAQQAQASSAAPSYAAASVVAASAGVFMARRPGHLSPTTITALKAGVGVRRGVSRGALGVLG